MMWFLNWPPEEYNEMNSLHYDHNPSLVARHVGRISKDNQIKDFQPEVQNYDHSKYFYKHFLCENSFTIGVDDCLWYRLCWIFITKNYSTSDEHGKKMFFIFIIYLFNIAENWLYIFIYSKKQIDLI